MNYCTASNVGLEKNSTTELAVNQIVEELIEASKKKVNFKKVFGY